MKLTREEEAMLGGELGYPVQKSMELLVALGELFEAERMIKVSHVHVAATHQPAEFHTDHISPSRKHGEPLRQIPGLEQSRPHEHRIHAGVDGAPDFVTRGVGSRIVELRQEHRINPFAVRRPGDMTCDLRVYMESKVVPHFIETVQISIVSERDLGTRKAERMYVVVVDRHPAIQSDATDMAEKAALRLGRGPMRGVQGYQIFCGLPVLLSRSRK